MLDVFSTPNLAAFKPKMAIIPARPPPQQAQFNSGEPRERRWNPTVFLRYRDLFPSVQRIGSASGRFSIFTHSHSLEFSYRRRRKQPRSHRDTEFYHRILNRGSQRKRRSALVRHPIQTGWWFDRKITRTRTGFSTAKYAKYANNTDEMSTANGRKSEAAWHANYPPSAIFVGHPPSSTFHPRCPTQLPANENGEKLWFDTTCALNPYTSANVRRSD